MKKYHRNKTLESLYVNFTSDVMEVLVFWEL